MDSLDTRQGTNVINIYGRNIYVDYPLIHNFLFKRHMGPVNHCKKSVQYPSESRTVRLSNGHLSHTLGPAFKRSAFQMVGTGPYCPVFFSSSLDRFGMNKFL
jgi:hypothetical protein